MANLSDQPVKPNIVAITLDANGAGTGTFQNNNTAAQVVIEQIGGRTTTVKNNASCAVFWNGNLVDTMYFIGAGGDSMGGDPAIFLEPSEYVTAVVSNGPANGTAIITFYFREVVL